MHNDSKQETNLDAAGQVSLDRQTKGKHVETMEADQKTSVSHGSRTTSKGSTSRGTSKPIPGRSPTRSHRSGLARTPGVRNFSPHRNKRDTTARPKQSPSPAPEPPRRRSSSVGHGQVEKKHVRRTRSRSLSPESKRPAATPSTTSAPSKLILLLEGKRWKKEPKSEPNHSLEVVGKKDSVRSHAASATAREARHKLNVDTLAEAAKRSNRRPSGNYLSESRRNLSSSSRKLVIDQSSSSTGPRTESPSIATKTGCPKIDLPLVDSTGPVQQPANHSKVSGVPSPLQSKFVHGQRTADASPLKQSSPPCSQSPKSRTRVMSLVDLPQVYKAPPQIHRGGSEPVGMGITASERREQRKARRLERQQAGRTPKPGSDRRSPSKRHLMPVKRPSKNVQALLLANHNDGADQTDGNSDHGHSCGTMSDGGWWTVEDRAADQKGKRASKRMERPEIQSLFKATVKSIMGGVHLKRSVSPFGPQFKFSKSSSGDLGST